jgi:hypothetical protein
MVEFVAVCRVGYPSDASTYWQRITYSGVIVAGSYKVNVKTEVLIASDVYIEYAGLLMAPGSQSIQKYGAGFDDFYLDADSYSLNSFNDYVTVRRMEIIKKMKL